MYTFEEKNRIIIQIASASNFEKDKDLFFKHCSKPKLEKDINRANEFTFAKVDAQMLNELLNYLTLEEILANREGELKSHNKKKQSTSKSKKKANSSKGGKRTRENKSKPGMVETIPLVETDKKKEPSEKSSPE